MTLNTSILTFQSEIKTQENILILFLSVPFILAPFFPSELLVEVPSKQQ